MLNRRDPWWQLGEDDTMWALVWAAVLLALLALGTLGACRLPTPPGPSTDAPLCDPYLPLPTVADLCDGLFTSEGFACVQCPGYGACVESTDVLYCTNQYGCNDPACRARTTAPRLRGPR